MYLQNAVSAVGPAVACSEGHCLQWKSYGLPIMVHPTNPSCSKETGWHASSLGPGISLGDLPLGSYAVLSNFSSFFEI